MPWVPGSSPPRAVKITQPPQFLRREPYHPFRRQPSRFLRRQLGYFTNAHLLCHFMLVMLHDLMLYLVLCYVMLKKKLSLS